MGLLVGLVASANVPTGFPASDNCCGGLSSFGECAPLMGWARCPRVKASLQVSSFGQAAQESQAAKTDEGEEVLP